MRRPAASLIPSNLRCRQSGQPLLGCNFSMNRRCSKTIKSFATRNKLEGLRCNWTMLHRHSLSSTSSTQKSANVPVLAPQSQSQWWHRHSTRYTAWVDQFILRLNRKSPRPRSAGFVRRTVLHQRCAMSTRTADACFAVRLARTPPSCLSH